MLMRVVFGVCLFGLGYYVGREVSRQHLNQNLTDSKARENPQVELTGANVETEYDDTNGGGRARR